MPLWVLKIRGLVGNNIKATILIAVFLIVLIFIAFRAKAGEPEVWITPAMSFAGSSPKGAALSMSLRVPVADGLYVDAGSTLWGATQAIRNNWDWHARMVVSRASRLGEYGAGLGMAYLQNTDALNGSHANFSLMLFYRPLRRVALDLIHLSNASTVEPNYGRNAVGVSFKLR